MPRNSNACHQNWWRAYACGMFPHAFWGHKMFANFSLTCYCKVCVSVISFFILLPLPLLTNVFMSTRCYFIFVVVVQTNASQLHTFAWHVIIQPPLPHPATHIHKAAQHAHCNGHWSTCVPRLFSFSVRSGTLCGNGFHLFRCSQPLQCGMQFTARMVHVANKLRFLTCATACARVCVFVCCAKSDGNCKIVSKTLKSFYVYTYICLCVSVCCKSICSQRNLCVPA